MRSGPHLVNTIGSLLVPLGALAVAPLVARGLGAVDRGFFANDQALMIVVSAAFAVGLSDAVAVHWMQWSAKSRRQVMLLNLVITLALTSAATAYLIWSPARHVELSLLAAFVLGCWTMTAANMARGVALSHSDIMGVGLDKIVVSLGRLLLTTILLLADAFTLEAAIASLAIPQLASWLMLKIRSFKSQTIFDELGSQQQFTKVSYKNIFLIVFGGLGGVLLVNLSQVLYLPLIGPTSLGYLAVALIVAELFTALAKPFRDAIFAAKKSTIDQLGKKVLLACTGVSLAVAIVGYFLLDWGVVFFFGEEFAPAIPAAKILLLGGALKGISYVVNGVLIVKGRPLARIYSTYAGVLVLVPVALFLSSYGAVGAAISLTAAYGLMLIIGVIFVMKPASSELAANEVPDLDKTSALK